MSCPFYGKAGFTVTYIPSGPHAGRWCSLIDSHGNQCALIKDSHAPCQMEVAGFRPDWDRCSFQNPLVIHQVTDRPKVLDAIDIRLADDPPKRDSE